MSCSECGTNEPPNREPDGTVWCQICGHMIGNGSSDD